MPSKTLKSGHHSAGPMPPVRPYPANGGQRQDLKPQTHTHPQPAPSGKAGQSEQNRIARGK
jgi:hypothetical protein